MASALFERPLEAAVTANGLAVPAHCEIVLEGEIDAGTAVEEGPVSEYHGMYEDYGAGMVVEFTRLTRRRDAMLQVIQPGYHPEHVWIGGEAIAASLAHRLRREFNIQEVAITPGGAGRLHAVVALKEGEPRRLMHAVWDAVRLIKLVTVVDADIDPWDAAAGRMGARDPHARRARPRGRACGTHQPLGSPQENAARSASSASMPRASPAIATTGAWRSRRPRSCVESAEG